MIERGDQFRWVMRTVSNFLLEVGRKCDFMAGIITFEGNAMRLTALTSTFELSNLMNRSSPQVRYDFLVTKAWDEDMGDVWVLKVSQRNQNA